MPGQVQWGEKIFPEGERDRRPSPSYQAWIQKEDSILQKRHACYPKHPELSHMPVFILGKKECWK